MSELNSVIARPIAHTILFIRNQKVILDADLAMLYGVTTKRLNEQVKRNKERFPNDFMFQLTQAEKQEVVAICDHLKALKYSKTNPYAFTEHGAIMAAGVLNTPQAIEVSVLVIRTFIHFRQMLMSNEKLRHKLADLERHLEEHDKTICSLVKTLQQLMQSEQATNKLPIGFASWSQSANFEIKNDSESFSNLI